MDNRSYYDTFAAGYERDRHQGYHRWLDSRSVALVRDLAKGARVLEVGCGTGLILREVSPVAQSAVGLDLSHGMLNACKTRNLTVIEASATQIPLADQRFDLVYSFKVLAHVEDISLALSEMARVTRPGGHLVLEFYNKQSLRFLVRRLRPPGRIGPETNENHVYTRFDDLHSLKALLPESLELVRLEGLRVATVIPQLFKIPGFGAAWAGFENLLSKSRLRRYAGFLVLVCRKG